jgi:hypothetical protein
MTTRQFLGQEWAAAFAPADRRPIWEWAHDKITELPAVYGDRRRFSILGSRHFEAPFQAIQSPRVHEIAILAPVRSGKTLVADISIPWFVAEEHASVLWVFNTDDIAKEHVELRLRPILDNSPCASMYQHDRFKTRAQEVVFTNGQPLFVKGAARSNLQARGFRVVVLDECWQYGAGILHEAKGRLGDFVRLGNHKFLCISQGGAHGTDWQMHGDAATRYEWEVPCAACGQHFAPAWTAYREDGSRYGMVYQSEKSNDIDVDIDLACATAAVECPACRHRHPWGSKTIGEWNSGGRYKGWDAATAPERVLFHWNALIDFPWPELVREWLGARKAQAMGNYEPLKLFIQKRLAEHDNPQGRSVHSIVHEFVRYEAAEGWEDQGAVIMTVDVQRMHYWVMVCAVSKKGGVVRRLYYDKCETTEAIDDVREQFKPSVFAVDVNYNRNKDNSVFRMIAARRGVGLIGDKAQWFPHRHRKVSGEFETVQKQYSTPSEVDAYEGTTAQAKERLVTVVRFSSDSMASRLQRMIDKGLWQEPTKEPDSAKAREYHRQMSSEHREQGQDANGRPIEKWVAHSKENHAWDCAKMVLIMSTILADAGMIEF